MSLYNPPILTVDPRAFVGRARDDSVELLFDPCFQKNGDHGFCELTVNFLHRVFRFRTVLGQRRPLAPNLVAGKATSALEECQQVGVKLVFVRVGETVGATRVDLQGGIPDQPC